MQHHLPLPGRWTSRQMARCEKEPAVILVLEEVRADLGGSQLRCPDCSGLLRRWGFARPPSLRRSGGGLVWLRPRRVRCAQLQGDPRAATRAGTPASRLRDRRRRICAAGQRLWPEPSHNRRRPPRGGDCAAPPGRPRCREATDPVSQSRTLPRRSRVGLRSMPAGLSSRSSQSLAQRMPVGVD
jgi:hypothetical protein